MATLFVTVDSAEGLKAKDIGGTSDPYVKLYLTQNPDEPEKEELVGKTKTVSRTISPVWNESFTAGPVRPGDVLLIEIWDSDLISKDDSLGRVIIPPSRIGKSDATERFAITAGTGEITLTMRLEGDLASASAGAASLKEWLAANPALPTSTQNDIGWMDTSPLFAQYRRLNRDVTEEYTKLYGDTTLSLEKLIPESVRDCVFVLVRGLFTRWYPGYMSHVVSEFERIGLSVVMAPVDTDVGVLQNADTLREFILNKIATAEGETKRVVLIAHSKGSLDAAAMLSIYPETKPHVAALVAAQAPYGGATLVSDLLQSDSIKQVTLSVVDRILSGDRAALADLTYAARREFLEKHHYPIEDIPTISLATSDSNMGSSLLRGSAEYVSNRYGEKSDGCVSLKDAYIPGSKIVYLHDMDHFGPAYKGFPALDNYDPARMNLVLLKLALESESAPQPQLVRGHHSLTLSVNK